jgi:hypothetical protein
VQSANCISFAISKTRLLADGLRFSLRFSLALVSDRTQFVYSIKTKQAGEAQRRKFKFSICTFCAADSRGGNAVHESALNFLCFLIFQLLLRGCLRLILEEKPTGSPTLRLRLAKKIVSERRSINEAFQLLETLFFLSSELHEKAIKTSAN